MNLRIFACLLVLLPLCASTVLADDIQLALQRGPAPGQVTLSWTGAPPQFEIYRSPSAAGVVAAPNLVATVPGPSFLDNPPDLPLLFYVVTQAATGACGNGVRDAGEQCDDGNLVRLDGCGPDCRFEQVQRAIWFKMQFTLDAVCTRNRLGLGVSTTGQTPLQSAIDAGIADGSTTLLFTALGISDLSGANEAQFSLGFVNGAPETRGGTLPYDGTNDPDWWHVVAPSSVDGTRLPISALPASITAHNLTAGPGPVFLPLFPGGPQMRMTSTQVSVTTGASSTPLVSSNGDPPGHLPAENLDPALTSYATCGAPTAAGSGHICGDVVARSLANLPINAQLVTTCSEGYTAANSMLDVFVTGCKFLGFVTVIAPTQPDRSDPDAPVAGAGPPYTFSAGAQHVVSACRDRLGATVDLNTCLDSAAYSSFFKFATNRVIPR